MIIRNTLLALLLVFTGSAYVGAEDAAPANMMTGMSYPMQKSMDPQVWMQMMTMMMDPAKAASMENCALCHEGEDLARYAKDFGPMMEPMQKMGEAMSPHQMLQGMSPMMGGMGNMMNPMSMMMNPMSMMYPAMGMMGPMMSMMGPMMNPMMMGGMMGPMMGMMNPMTMMGGMGGMNAMNPMGMMGGMGGMNAMNPMGMMGGSTGGGYNNTNPMSGMMKPEQYTDWFNQMMKQFQPAQTPAAK
ncbi:MAG: hypothetical protein AB8B89_09570 [Gammaproteobacteria bacterium]